jgi:hypothetical protein
MVCLGAVVLDAVKRVGAWQPLNRADLSGDLLYLPESLYCIGLAVDAGRAWTLEPRRCDCSAPRQLRYGARPSPTAKVRLGRRTSEPPTTA